MRSVQPSVPGRHSRIQCVRNASCVEALKNVIQDGDENLDVVKMVAT
jgi:hypothetical protein